MKLDRALAVGFVVSFLYVTGVVGCGDSPEGPRAPEASPFSVAAFVDPPKGYRPWVRWWWPGGDVEDEELTREVRILSENYLGGAEIQAFDAALDPGAGPDELARRRSFDTESYYRHLARVMEEARTQGLPIDLTLGSGWPSGGMHVLPEGSLKALLWSEHGLSGPGIATVSLRDPDKPAFYLIAELAEQLLGEKLARYEGELAKIIAVVAAAVTGGSRSPNPLDLTDHVAIDPGSVRILTELVDDDGTLTWEVPQGDWRVIAFYEAPDGEYPLLNAQPEPGYVLDHLDRTEVLAHLERLLGARPGLDRYRGAPLRGFFNDSLEFKAERLYASDLLEEFSLRRGYDVTPWLPAVLVPGADNSTLDNAAIKRSPEFTLSDEDDRVRYDYVHTVSDLFIERFVEGATDWAAERGLLFRSQGYGLNIDTIRAAGAAHIPEAEQLYAGGSEIFLNMVSSGALLYNRPIVSAEAMVWMGRPYMTTPLKIKASADKLFTSGINQIVFHGFPYQKNHVYGEPGWYPFSSPFGGSLQFSSNISEKDPFWQYMPRLNRYIARCQYALRQGRPSADLLVYYPWLGIPTTLAAIPDHDEPLFNGQMGRFEPEAGLNTLLGLAVAIGISEVDPRVEWLASRWPLFQELERSGYRWAWVNDESLEEAGLVAGEIEIRGNRFHGVLIAESPAMRPGAASRLASLARAGAAIVLVGESPAHQPGFGDFERGDAEVAGAMEEVRSGPRVRILGTQAGVAQALEAIGVPPGLTFLSGGGEVRYLRRDLGAGRDIFFLSNVGADAGEVRFMVEGGCKDARWVDVWRETSDPVGAGEDGSFEVILPPYGSGLLMCGLSEAGEEIASPFGSSRTGAGQLMLSIPLESWTLSVKGDDVPGGRVSLALNSFPDWRDLEGLRFSSSHGTYRTQVDAPPLTQGETAWLTVGWVHGAAEVRINGQAAGSLLAPPYTLELGRRISPGVNQIEIEVIPALRNRFVGKGAQGDEHYRQFAGNVDTLLPNGIEGPAVLEIRSP